MRADEQPAVRRAIDRFLEHVDAELADRVIEVRLFGSSVRDDWRPDSDVDLLVVVDHKDWQLVGQLHETWLDALVEDHVDLSPRIVAADHLERLRAEGNAFARNVDTEGKLLWTRTSAQRSTGT